MLTGEKLGPEIISELCRYSPSEALFNAAILDYNEVTAYIERQLACSAELLDEAAFAPDACIMAEMRAQFGDAPEKMGGLASESPAFTALAVPLGYLKETQKVAGVWGVVTLPYTNYAGSAVYAAFARHARQPGADGNDARAREKRYAAVGCWIKRRRLWASG